MSHGVLISLILTAMTAATPLLFAALGELVVERAGVLNLGVEGMMLTGAVSAFIVRTTTGDATLAIMAGGLAGVALAAIFGTLTLFLRSNQVATGLALTIFGSGVSALLGARFTGIPVPALPTLPIPGLSSLPVLGPIFFDHDAMVYLSLLAPAGIAWFLERSRPGLILRGVGEAHGSAHALGYGVLRVRFLAVLFGGLMSGFGGAYLSLAYTPLWVENMTAGRGWISLAIVVFAAWRPWRALGGAYLFGGITILQLYLQANGPRAIPTQLFSMLPYAATIVVLTLISAGPARRRLGAPACLGMTFVAPR